MKKRWKRIKWRVNSLKSSIKKNYFYNVSYQIFALIVPLITTPYISRVLGAEGVGEYSYTYAMVRYFWILSALGASTFGTRNIGIFQENKEKRSYCFWNLFFLKVILSMFFITLYILYVIIFAQNKIIGFLQGINLFAVMVDITWFFNGIEEFKKITIKNFVIKILNVIYIFLFVKDKGDLNIYVFGLAFFLLLGNLSMWTHLKNYVSRILIKKLNPFSYLKPVIQLFIPSIATQIFSIFDKSMIGWFTQDSAENGYYEQALKIVDMALVLITTMGTIMIPRISREYSKGHKETVKIYIDKSLRFTLMFALPMTLGIIAISEKFVPIFFGEEYTKTIYLLNILSLLFIFMGLNSVTGSQYLISTGQQNKHVKFLLIGGTINVILNAILIPQIMSIGAAIASVIGECVITILEMNYLNKIKQYNVKNIIKYSKIYFIAAIIMFIAISIITRSIESILGVLLAVMLGGIIYFIILMLFKDEMIIEQINKIKTKLLEKVR